MSGAGEGGSLRHLHKCPTTVLCTGHKYNIQCQLHLRKNNPNTTPTQKRVTKVEDAPPRARAENVFGARCVFRAVKVGGAKTTSLSPSRAPGVWGCRPLRGEPTSISQRSVRCVSIPAPGGDSGRGLREGTHPGRTPTQHAAALPPPWSECPGCGRGAGGFGGG